MVRAQSHPQPSSNFLIILDNANYHNTVVEKTPTKSWTKRAIKARLDNLYHTDRLAHQHGHEVVRLPISHCELNPIEMAWATLKDYIRKNNTTFRLSDVQSLIPAAFDEVTSSHWEKMR
uniref:Tc1-like transposase DDE domain-containing protein n=1 Tax=Amphimedon queenslandica TaxID=400682 RepID=A0A1X7UWU3_AMPQE